MQQEIQKEKIQHKMLATHINLNSNLNKCLVVIFYIVFVLWNFTLDWYIIIDYKYYSRTTAFMQQHTHITPDRRTIFLETAYTKRYQTAVKAQVPQCVGTKATVSNVYEGVRRS